MAVGRLSARFGGLPKWQFGDREDGVGSVGGR